MRSSGIWLVMGGLCLPALAQTNAPVTIKELSLQDCIQMSVRQNLDLQIDRLESQVPFYTLESYYGAYDPTFSVSGQHDHVEQGTTLLGSGFAAAGSIYDDNSFSSSIKGLLPWGTQYQLGTAVKDTYGSSAASVNDFSQPIGTRTTGFVQLPDGTIVPSVLTNYAQLPSRTPFENSDGSVALTVTQPLLKNFWINTAELNIKVAKNRLKYSEQTLRLQLMQTITKVEQAYYDLIYDQENILVQEKAVELAMQLVVENKKKVEVGALAPLDEKQAESQAASSQAALIAARSTLAVQQATIKQLITSKYSEWSSIPLRASEMLAAPRQFFNLQDSWGKGLTQRPEILQAKLDLEQAGIQLKFAKNQLLPELDVFGTFGYNGAGREFSDALYDIQRTDRPYYTYGGSISTPLANTAARNNYRSAKVSREESVLSVKKMERDIMYAIDTDIRQAQSSYEQVAARKAAREYAEAALEAEQKKLENGKSTTYTVLQMQRDLTSARGDEIQALATYNKNLSQLSLDEATTLERLRVRLTIR